MHLAVVRATQDPLRHNSAFIRAIKSDTYPGVIQRRLVAGSPSFWAWTSQPCACHPMNSLGGMRRCESSLPTAGECVRRSIWAHACHLSVRMLAHGSALVALLLGMLYQLA